MREDKRDERPCVRAKLQNVLRLFNRGKQYRNRSTMRDWELKWAWEGEVESGICKGM